MSKRTCPCVIGGSDRRGHATEIVSRLKATLARSLTFAIVFFVAVN